MISHIQFKLYRDGGSAARRWGREGGGGGGGQERSGVVWVAKQHGSTNTERKSSRNTRTSSYVPCPTPHRGDNL